MTQHENVFAERCLALAKEGDSQQLEALWLENLDSLPTQSDFYKKWLTALRRAGIGEQGESLTGLALESLIERKKWRGSMRVGLAAAPFYPASAPLRPLLVKAMRGFYSDLENFDQILRASGLAGNASLVEGYQAFREWTRLSPGQVYQHTDWGEGVVRELDLDGRQVTLVFGNDQQKVMTIDGVKRYLKYIEPNHILARRARQPETLQKLAETDPVALVKEALTSQPDRRIRQGELKTVLTGGIVAPEDWTGWWGKAREALKLDPYVDFDASGGARAVIALRDQPRSFEEEIKDGFLAADATTALKADLIRQLARRPKDAPLPLALAQAMSRRLEEDWALAGDGAPVARLEIAYMLADLAQAVPEAGIRPPDPKPILAAFEEYDALTELDHVDYGIRALEALLARDGDQGRQRATEMFPQAPVRLAQAIWSTLDADHHLELAVAALQRLMDEPLANVDTYSWAVRSILDGSWGHMDDYFPAEAVVPDIIQQMEDWQKLASESGMHKERAKAAKSLLSRMRTLLGAGNFAAISKAVENMNREGVTRLRRLIQTCSALPSSAQNLADRAIRLTRRDLEDETAVQPEDEVHLCTAKAYAMKAAELREITSVKIPANTKAIEEARNQGDLRENAGYQYAKEEQKMLMQQQASLADLLSRARIVHAGEIDVTAVCFGSTLRALNQANGQEERYTIMGRWEADPEHHVISMQAPLACQFMGHKVGDHVTIQHPGGGSTPYKILEITDALAEGNWNGAEESHN